MPQEFPSIPYLGPARSRYGSFNKRYMVVHCTANNAPPVNECRYAMTRTDGVGLHFASDPATVMQGLESWYGTGHVGSTTGNSYGISWEFVGFLTSSTDYYRACIDRAAPSMRTVMAKHGIPHVWLTDAQLRAGNVKGLVTHLQCSRVLGGSTHTDPGPNFPQQYLIDALNGVADMTPEESQMLRNVHDWLFDANRGLVQADAGTAHIGTYVPNQWLKAVHDRPPVDPDAVATALAGNAEFVEILATAVAGKIGESPTLEDIAAVTNEEMHAVLRGTKLNPDA